MGIYTTNYNLFMPTIGEQGWGDLVNGNFTTIDTTMAGLNTRVGMLETEVDAVEERVTTNEGIITTLEAGEFESLKTNTIYLPSINSGLPIVDVSISTQFAGTNYRLIHSSDLLSKSIFKYIGNDPLVITLTTGAGMYGPTIQIRDDKGTVLFTASHDGSASKTHTTTVSANTPIRIYAKGPTANNTVVAGVSYKICI